MCVGGGRVCMWRVCALVREGGGEMWGSLMVLGYDVHISVHHQPKMLVESTPLLHVSR